MEMMKMMMKTTVRSVRDGSDKNNLLPLKYFRYETEQRGERARSATKYSSARDYYDSRRRSAETEPVVRLLKVPQRIVAFNSFILSDNG